MLVAPSISHVTSTSLSVLKALVILFFSLNAVFTAEIAATSSNSGDYQPNWKEDMALQHLIIIEGAITFNRSEKNNIRLEIFHNQESEALKSSEPRPMLHLSSKSYIGNLEVTKIHFVDSQTTMNFKQLGELQSGKIKNIATLIPMCQSDHNGKPSIGGLWAGQKNSGIHVFKYKSSSSGEMLLHSTQIPHDELHLAQQVIIHRKNKEYHQQATGIYSHNRGYAGFQFKFQDNTIIANQALKGGPAHSAGMKPGDKIVSIDGVSIETPQPNKDVIPLYQQMLNWRSGDTTQLFVERDKQLLQLELQLLSKRNLQKSLKAQASPKASLNGK